MLIPASSGPVQIMADPPSASAKVRPHVKSGCTHSPESWQSCTGALVGHGAGIHLTNSVAPVAIGVPQHTSPGTHVADDMQVTAGKFVNAAVLT